MLYKIKTNAFSQTERFGLGRVPYNKWINMRKASRMEPMIKLGNTRLNNV